MLVFATAWRSLITYVRRGSLIDTSFKLENYKIAYLEADDLRKVRSMRSYPRGDHEGVYACMYMRSI